MRAILTGGAGLLGRALAASLSTDGYETILLSRTPERVRDLPKNTRVERWDGRTAAGWGKLADGADVIVNLAGENLASGLWTAERKARLRQSRINAGRAVVEAVQASRSKPKVVIQQSGIGHYGIHGDEVLTEDDKPGTDFLASVTLDWEAATAPVEEMGVRRVVTRSAIVFTPKGGILSLMALPFHLFVGGPVGSGRQWLAWIHIDDHISAMRFLIDNPQASGPFNLTAPNPVTNAEFGRVLGRVLGRPALMPAPAIALKLALGEMSMMILEGQRAVPERLVKLGFAFRYPDIESALRNLLR